MKRILFLLSLVLPSLVNAQSGPGGVGSSSNIESWLDANSLGLSNGASVSSWTDLSGNANHAAEGTTSLQPLFRTNEINGRPAIEFDGTDDKLDFTSHITSNSASIFMVYKRDAASSSGSLLFTNKHGIYSTSGGINSYYFTPTTKFALGQTNGAYNIFCQTTGPSAISDTLILQDFNTIASHTRNTLWNHTVSVLGARFSTSYYLHYKGHIAEVIIYDEFLNTASRNIVNNYLGAKYGVNFNPFIYAYGSTHGHGVIGIGAEADGSNTEATGLGRVTINNASSLGLGDYLLVGHDNGGFSASTSTPNGVAQRWTQVYRADETGVVGTVDLVFDFNGATLPSSNPNNYVLIVENSDGDFSNGGTTTINASSVNIGALTVTFNGVTLSDGNYFTLGEKVGDIASDQDGQWDQTSTWDCNCIPTDENNVEINHNVTIDSDAQADDVILSSGSLVFSGSDTLSIKGDFGIASTFTKGSGTIAATSTTFQQTFTNSTGNPVEFHNLYVNCTDPLILNTGDWEIDNNLQVSSGGLDVSSANTTTLTSDASATSQILPSINNAFTGNFTVQRFVSARNANYGNFSSPMDDATIADLDDDLFLSGLNGGGDGNARVAGGGTFYSVYEYNAEFTKHDTIDDVTDVMREGIGYEIYLATVLGSFSATTIDFVGTPATAAANVKDPTIHPGWNLLGNPYHAFLNYDNLDLQSDLSNTFYIYNSSTGAYSAFSQGSSVLIAPSQGFWVDKTSGVARSFTFEENDKSESHSSTFVRKSKSNALSLNISEVGSVYNQDLIVNFSSNASITFDEFDARYLPSPHKEVPALVSNASNSDEELIINSLDNLSLTHVIPVELKSGKQAKYEINAQNIDQIYDYYDCVYLNDKKADQLIDLSVDPIYQFESNEGDFNRFDLIVSKDYENCQKTIDNGISSIQKIENSLSLRNNNNGWWLDYQFENDFQHQLEVRIYNLSGQEVIAPASLNVERAGTIELNQLDQLNGIYLIQIISEGEILNKTIQL